MRPWLSRLGVGATWAGIVFAYDSYYWIPSHRGLPVSFFVVFFVVAEFALLSVVQRLRRGRRARRDRGLVAPRRDAVALTMFSSFMTNAWIERDHRGVLAGVVGFFVVLRAASFAAHAIPNGAFAGAAGANLVGLNPLVGLDHVRRRRGALASAPRVDDRVATSRPRCRSWRCSPSARRS